jgi:hypothetical protein
MKKPNQPAGTARACTFPRLGLLLATAATLAACGGGSSDDGNNASASVTASDAQLVAYVKSSNIDFLPTNRPAGTWRWSSTPAQHVLVYIPAPANGNTTEQDYAAKVNVSIAQMNAKLNGWLVLEAVAALPSSGNYIRVSYGTSYVPPGSTNYAGYCANVATGPSIGNVIQPDSANGIASSPVYVNLGNGHCDVTQGMVSHEFGHALGLANHFEGFGTGDAISTAFWDVLATLYGTPQSTPASGLVVKRAAS